MATLDCLKQALRYEASAVASDLKLPLSDSQYSAAFEILMKGPGWMTYQDFVIPQLSQLLAPLLESRVQISVLEVGPGPKSILGYLPEPSRRKIGRYTAFEPNYLFATRLEEWFCYSSTTESRLPHLDKPPEIHRSPFVLNNNSEKFAVGSSHDEVGKYDVVLFCHSMYGMKPKRRFVEQALEVLADQAPGGVVAVFHRDGVHFNGLACHKTAFFPTGEVQVADNDGELDRFASFVAGFVPQDVEVCKALRVKWREMCRTMGRREKGNSDHLSFSSPETMVAFTRHATTLPELLEQVPQVKGSRTIKNRESQARRPTSICRPTEIRHIQQCVRWALEHELSLTVIGGGHSGHCILSNVASIDMSAFDKVHVLMAEENGDSSPGPGSLVFVEAGCNTGHVVRETMAAGVTVPLGARPSVGAGLWLQGGIGHLSRLHGLACDAIVGAVIVSVASSQVFCVGHVPSQHWPAGAVRPEAELDLLWAIKGAGTNFGIVVGVTCRVFTAPTYLTRNWMVPLNDEVEARQKLSDFDRLMASQLPSNCSADAYLYWDSGQLHLGVTMFEVSVTGSDSAIPTPTYADILWGPGKDFKAVNSVDLFDADMYVSGMHGGHAGGKTSSFKRCLFLKSIGRVEIVDRLVVAIESRPSPLCYLHLLQGGGAVGDVSTDATAFGCRDWDFACVITGVWPRDQDGTELARSAMQWVYQVAGNLLPLSSGAYGADLGPDPRDTVLAAKVFGPNRSRLAHLKQRFDPCNVLAYACPLPKPTTPKLIILVTGETCSGKDYCADVWASFIAKHLHQTLTARVVSISEATKREYAAATGADLGSLLHNRAYKEQHRPALTAFFQEQARQRPELLREHFLNVVHDAEDVDVLLITGMREEAPAATMSYLVSGSRVLEINVQVSEQTRQKRRGHPDSNEAKESNDIGSGLTVLNYHPGLIFNNDATGSENLEIFAEHHLLPFFHEDLERLTEMVRTVPNYPRLGIKFRHVLGISEQPGGLALCTSLLQNHFTGDWSKVDAIVSCEAGGFVYASALASRVNVPLVLVRESGKLPPPIVSVVKGSSHITSLATNFSEEKRIEMGRDAVPRGASVVVVDDVLSTGETLCAVLQLLGKVGICSERVSVMVVAEFPVHHGRKLLYLRGFGKTNVQSLLIFDGA